MVLHALTSLTYVVVGMQGASDISVDPEPVESFVGSFTPQRGETQCLGILIHIGGPALTIQGFD